MIATVIAAAVTAVVTMVLVAVIILGAVTTMYKRLSRPREASAGPREDPFAEAIALTLEEDR